MEQFHTWQICSGNYTSPSMFKPTGLLLSHNDCSCYRGKTPKTCVLCKIQALWWGILHVNGMKFRSLLSTLHCRRLRMSVRGTKLCLIPKQGRYLAARYRTRFSCLPWLCFGPAAAQLEMILQHVFPRGETWPQEWCIFRDGHRPALCPTPEKSHRTFTGSRTPPWASSGLCWSW